MQVTLVVEYDDFEVGAQRIADSLFDLVGVDGVEITDLSD